MKQFTDKRQQILDTALRLFVAHGFHGTPTSRIAQEAGVATGTLFNCFATKDELIVALYLSVKAGMMQDVAAAVQPGAGLKETLQSMYAASLGWALAHPVASRFMEQFGASPFPGLVAPEQMEQQVKPHRLLLQQGIREGTIRNLPVDLLFTLISSHVYGMNQYLNHHRHSKAKRQQLVADSFELLWRMLT